MSPIYNVVTKTTDDDGKTTHLGQVRTEIADTGRAQELAERAHGPNVTVVRESHLAQNSHGVYKKDD